MELVLVAHDDDAGVADPRFDVNAAPTPATRAASALARKWSSRPPCPPITIDPTRSRASTRGVERELEVGGVLGYGVALDHGAGGDGGVEVGRVGGVEIADDEVDGEPERERVVEPGVGGDHELGRAGRQSAGGGRIAPREHERDMLAIGPSAGITRIRFEGSATHDGRPLSPAVPSSPGIQLSGASYAFAGCVRVRTAGGSGTAG